MKIKCAITYEWEDDIDLNEFMFDEEKSKQSYEAWLNDDIFYKLNWCAENNLPEGFKKNIKWEWEK